MHDRLFSLKLIRSKIFTSLSFLLYTWDEYWKSIEIDDLNYGDRTDKIRDMDLELLFEQIETFNRSILFLRELDYANVPLKAQKRLNIKGYHISQISTYLQQSFHIHRKR